MASAKAILQDALALPAEARAEVARELLVSLDAPVHPDVAESWLVEIERRVREAEGGTAMIEDWSTVRERIAARLRSMRP
ncbi:MAG: addiction module protein [Deltaproteobacteria bacterium]|nr:addiction module protein [Deltaproteobacteria bacterium]